MTDLERYALEREYKLSAEMSIALSYIAQGRNFRGLTHGRTLTALRKRRLVDKENRLTEAGWECYIKLTDAGPCITNRLDGWVQKDPRQQYEAAKPRLDKIASSKKKRFESNSLDPSRKAAQKSRTSVFRVQEVKYGGRLIELDDGSRWEVDDDDSKVSKSWSEIDHVVIIDDEMYRLDDSEKVIVKREN